MIAREALRSLVHPSSLVCLVAVVPVAYWLGEAAPDADWMPGAVFAASFAVFALLLTAVGSVHGTVERLLDDVPELLARGSEVRGRLASRSRRLALLASSVGSLQRGVTMTVVATVASSVAVVLPTFTLWDQAPALLESSPPEIAAAMALVALVAAVFDMFPFTWNLIVPSRQLDSMSLDLEAHVKTLDVAATPPAPQAPKAGSS